MSQSWVWGGSPTSVFAARRDAKIASVATLALLAKMRNPQHGAKNGGYAFFYVSSVSFDAFIAWIVASTIFNSLSSKAFNMASIRFLHSLPLFWDG